MSERTRVIGDMDELLYQVSAEVCSTAGLIDRVRQYILIIV